MVITDFYCPQLVWHSQQKKSMPLTHLGIYYIYSLPTYELQNLIRSYKSVLTYQTKNCYVQTICHIKALLWDLNTQIDRQEIVCLVLFRHHQCLKRKKTNQGKCLPLGVTLVTTYGKLIRFLQRGAINNGNPKRLQRKSNR